MENQGNVICRARFIKSIRPFIITFILLIIGFVLCIVLNRITINSITKDANEVEKGLFNYYYEEENDYVKSIYEGKVFLGGKINATRTCIVKKTYQSYPTWRIEGETWAVSETDEYGMIFIYLTIAFYLPLIILAFLSMIKSKNCSLSLSTDQIEGQLKTTFGKKKLQIPIDHLDNVMTSSGFWDKVRGGETLLISSNSGLIKFHYVQNAEEFAQAAMKRIDEVKKSATVPQNAPAPVQSVSGGNAMEKMNSLKQMLDSGLISQEDFEAKKQDILSKI